MLAPGPTDMIFKYVPLFTIFHNEICALCTSPHTQIQCLNGPHYEKILFNMRLSNKGPDQPSHSHRPILLFTLQPSMYSYVVRLQV